ncbi:MAG: type I DNA topoisomerase [Acidobacteriota bacterium]
MTDWNMAKGSQAKRNLVIVESPAKARTIERYLGEDYFVRASKGHVRDLPERALGVDIKHGFRPTYRIIPGKESVVAQLRKDATQAKAIYLAADPDREGEAICFHLAELLAGNGGSEVYRVLCNEITRDAIREAFAHPTAIDQNKVDAQQARRILDRLVGYKISPLLWQKVRKGLSAGRVQTVAVRLIVDREREIRAFVPEEYWEFQARLEGAKPPVFVAKAVRRNGKKFKVGSREEADALYEELQRSEFVVRSVTRKERKRNPLPPFTTSQLQQEAVRKLGFTVRKTMEVAQRLYEGVELGPEGRVGLITYMRTDSTRVAESALQEVRGFIGERFGKDYLPSRSVKYASKAGAQDAHEAIRPTSVLRDPESVRSYLGRDELRLYTLIWNRFVASQMTPARYDQTEIVVAAGSTEFKAVGSILKFDGFLKVWRNESKSAEDGESDAPEAVEGTLLPDLQEGEILKVHEIKREQKFTQPPPRYNEASLVKALEERGIGRPSTYQQILAVIQKRDYVRKEEGRFVPTELAEIVNDLLVEHFGSLFDYDYTAKLEEELDRIEEGSLSWLETLERFYRDFRERLEAARTRMQNLRKEVEETDQICEKCGGKMVIRLGKFGRFLACSNFPRCRNTREVGQEAVAASDVATAECPNCGKTMTVRRGRFGPFLACPDYPKCRGTRRLESVKGGWQPAKETEVEGRCPECDSPLVRRNGRYGEFIACARYPTCRFARPLSTGVRCPQCGEGELVQRRSKRGRFFYGCEKYPDCNFTLWQKPVPKTCPACGKPYLLERTTKKTGTIWYCADKECGFSMPVDHGGQEAVEESSQEGEAVPTEARSKG